jgi:hypothetical protein
LFGLLIHLRENGVEVQEVIVVPTKEWKRNVTGQFVWQSRLAGGPAGSPAFSYENDEHFQR